jgi:hypothetical protein
MEWEFRYPYRAETEIIRLSKIQNLDFMASTNTEKKQPLRIECINPILNVKSLPVSREN